MKKHKKHKRARLDLDETESATSGHEEQGSSTRNKTDEYEFWLVKKPISISGEELSNYDIWNSKSGEFSNSDGQTYEFEKRKLADQSIFMFEKSADSQNAFEQIELSPKGTVVIAITTPECKVALPKKDEYCIPPISSDLRQRFTPFGIIEKKKKHKKHKKR